MGNSAARDCNIIAIMCCAGTDELSEGARNRASQYIDGKREKYSIPTMEIRQSFVEVPMVRLQAVSNHTHGLSAADRSSGSIMIGNIAGACGKKPVYFQGSSADVRNGRMISRDYHWVKDINAPASSYAPHDEDLVAMVDVDYYVDMNEFLLRNFRPIVLYTFQPQTLGCAEGEFSFCFDDQGRVRYDVSGGSGYAHHVWHYIGDSVKVTKKFLGFTYECSTFALEKRAMGPHHQLVLFAPIARFKGISAWVADKLLAGDDLKRLDPRVGNGFTRMQVQSTEGLFVQTGKINNHAFANVPKHVDDEIASVARVSKTFTISMVKQRLNDTNAPGTTLLHEYHLLKSVLWGPKVAVVDPYVRSYQFIEKLSDLDEDSKPSMVSFMNPIVDAAYCPLLGVNNERRGVLKRITELQKKPLEPTPFLLQCMEEFVDLLAEGLGGKRLFPVEISEVYLRQSKPTQQRILESAEYEGATTESKTFGKREAYQTLNDMRIISQINGVDKRDYSTFMYALGDYLKDMPWYASGKSNVEIADRIAELCEKAKSHVSNTDFARLDGTINALLRLLERMVMVKLFHQQYQEEMLRTMKTQRNLRGRTTNGVKYVTLDTRLSGSPETSPFNSMENAFVAFLAGRLDRKTPREAWEGLGMYLGDDGVTADTTRKSYEKAAAMVGLVLTAETVKRGEMGVSFLSRRYGPDVWFGDNNSCCSISRTVSKFHVTVHMPSSVRAVDKLSDKSYALWINDSQTPIIGALVAKVVSITGINYKSIKNLSHAWNVNPTGAYPNVKADWMYDLARAELPNYDIDAFDAWISKVKNLYAVLDIPEFNVVTPPKAKAGIIEMDGDILVVPGPRAEPAPSVEPAQPKSSTRRKRRSRGSPNKTQASAPNSAEAVPQTDKKTLGKGKTRDSTTSKGPTTTDVPPN